MLDMPPWVGDAGALLQSTKRVKKSSFLAYSVTFTCFEHKPAVVVYNMSGQESQQVFHKLGNASTEIRGQLDQSSNWNRVFSRDNKSP